MTPHAGTCAALQPAGSAPNVLTTSGFLVLHTRTSTRKDFFRHPNPQGGTEDSLNLVLEGQLELETMREGATRRERKKRGEEMSDVVIQASATLSVRDNKCSKNNGSDQTLKGHDVSRYTLNNYHNELGTGSYLTIRLLNSTIHIPWRRKERRGEVVVQLSTTPSVRDDESSEITEVTQVCRGHLNTVSTFVGMLLIETTRGVITWLTCSHEDLDRHESMRKVLMSWIEKKEEQRNEWVFEKYFKRISLSKFMQEVVAALLKLGIIRAPSATHIRASVWIGRTNLIGTLRRSRSVIRVYFYITQDSKIIPTEAQIPCVSFTRSILNSICLFHSREDFRKGIGERCRILPLRVTCTRRSGPFRNDNGVGGRRE